MQTSLTPIELEIDELFQRHLKLLAELRLDPDTLLPLAEDEVTPPIETPKIYIKHIP